MRSQNNRHTIYYVVSRNPIILIIILNYDFTSVGVTTIVATNNQPMRRIQDAANHAE